MSESIVTTPEATTAWEEFDATTSRWGRITMIAGMILMIGGPTILAIQLGVNPAAVAAGVVAIALTFGVIWVVEPVSYYPILGPASMYQAFMIGNISNKLLPAAVIAQNTIGAKPGTRRGQLAAVLAISGAAFMHLGSLLLFVGILGTLLVSAIPAAVTSVVTAYVLPAIMGAVIVQLIAGNRQWRIVTIALAVGAVVVFVLTPLWPTMSYVGIAVAVVATIALALLVPERPTAGAPSVTDPDEDLS